MKMRNDYDVTKNMLKTIRTISESKQSTKTLQEQLEMGNLPSDVADQEQKNDVTVVNDVDVKLLSNDSNDLKVTDSQKNAISQLIDGFRQQVSQIADFEPGFTLNTDQIRLDGKLPDEDITFVFIAGKDGGIYINADMLKLEQTVATMLEKLAKFEETFRTAMEPLITERNNNI